MSAGGVQQGGSNSFRKSQMNDHGRPSRHGVEGRIAAVDAQAATLFIVVHLRFQSIFGVSANFFQGAHRIYF